MKKDPETVENDESQENESSAIKQGSTAHSEIKTAEVKNIDYNVFHLIDWNVTGISGLCALILVFIHWILPHIRKRNVLNLGLLNAIGGGLALGYVFLHALPDLVHSVPHLMEGTKNIFFQNKQNLLFTVFICVLSGFLVLYSLEKIAFEYTYRGQDKIRTVYFMNLGLLIYLVFSVALLMPFWAMISHSALVLFTIILVFQFILEDQSMSNHFPSFFNRAGRYCLMISAVVGWCVGIMAHHFDAKISVSCISAFLSGALILSTIKSNFASQTSHSIPFLSSLFVKVIVIGMMVLLENVR